MSYPVILGNNRRQLQAVLKLAQFKGKANIILGAYGEREELYDVGVAILLCRSNGKWALLCVTFTVSVEELKPLVWARARGLEVVWHSQFAKQANWRKILEKH